MSSFSARTIQDADDGYFSPNIYDYTSNFINIGDTTVAGVRFQNVTIPPGAVINAATLSMKKPGFGDPGGATTLIYGIAEDNTADMSTDPKGRTKTSASTAYNFPSFTVANTVYTSGDISAQIQEIVNRAGWASGNALGLLIVGTDHSGNRQGFISYHWDPTNSPLLSITYTVPSGAVITKQMKYAIVRPQSAITKLLRYTTVDLELNPVAFSGLKVAKSGHNALNTNKPESFNFHSDYGTLKYFAAGTIKLHVSHGSGIVYNDHTHIDHNLGYYPFAIVYAQDNAMPYPQPLGRVQAGSGITRSFNYYLTKNSIYFGANGFTGPTGGGDTYDVTFYYKLFKNNLGIA